jgi:hypothetical protein
MNDYCRLKKQKIHLGGNSMSELGMPRYQRHDLAKCSERWLQQNAFLSLQWSWYMKMLSYKQEFEINLYQFAACSYSSNYQYIPTRSTSYIKSVETLFHVSFIKQPSCLFTLGNMNLFPPSLSLPIISFPRSSPSFSSFRRESRRDSGPRNFKQV